MTRSTYTEINLRILLKCY